MPEGAAFFIHLPHRTLRLPRSRRSLMEMHLENNKNVHPKLDGWWNDTNAQQRIPFLFLLHMYWLHKGCWCVSNRILLYWTFHILSAAKCAHTKKYAKMQCSHVHNGAKIECITMDTSYPQQRSFWWQWYNELATCFVHAAVRSPPLGLFVWSLMIW